jgi:TonB family protein
MAAGWLYENAYGDTTEAVRMFRRVIDEYPNSDEYGDALEILGLQGTEYDSLYSEKLYRMAEAQYFDYKDPDSALVLFKMLKYRFPDSQLLPKAEFAMAKIRLEKFTPKKAPAGDSTYVDSTMIWAFQDLARKYPGTALGAEAGRLAAGEAKEKPKRKIPQQKQQKQGDSTEVFVEEDSTSEWDDTLTVAQQQEARIQQVLEELPLAPDKPSLEPEFQYPLSAYGDPFEGKIMTKIKIEFDGRVTEVELLKPSGQDDIDNEVRRVLLLTEFDPMEIEPLHIGGYFIYYYQVTPPESIRRRD